MSGSQRIKRRGWRDDIDTILLILTGTFEIQSGRAAERTGIHVIDSELERVAAIQLDIAVKECVFPDRSCRSLRQTSLQAVRTANGMLGSLSDGFGGVLPFV
jgi:hypothetical protein